MLKAITRKLDEDGHLVMEALKRDLSGTVTKDIITDTAMLLASDSQDGIMPQESFATIQDLVNKVAALTGSIIPKGTIQEHTADVTQKDLTTFV
jgi:hypothetical protein